MSLILGVVPLCLLGMEGGDSSAGGEGYESDAVAPAAKRARVRDERSYNGGREYFSDLMHGADAADHVSPTPPPGVETGADGGVEEESNYVLLRAHWRDAQHRLWGGYIKAEPAEATFIVQADFSATGIGQLRLDNVVLPAAVLPTFYSAISELIGNYVHGQHENPEEVLHHFVTNPAPSVLLSMMVNFLRAAPGENFPALMEMFRNALVQIGIGVHFQLAGGAHAAAPAPDLPTPIVPMDNLSDAISPSGRYTE